jgi:hypothetical protein
MLNAYMNTYAESYAQSLINVKLHCIEPRNRF